MQGPKVQDDRNALVISCAVREAVRPAVRARFFASAEAKSPKEI